MESGFNGGFMKNQIKEIEIVANRKADEVIERMQGLSLKDIEKLVLNQSDKVAKLILIKMIRKSQ